MKSRDGRNGDSGVEGMGRGRMEEMGRVGGGNGDGRDGRNGESGVEGMGMAGEEGM